jgi:L-malate glycosyltransferase
VGATVRYSGDRNAIRVLHLVSPQPRGDAGGADLHVVDLANAQLRGGPVIPFVGELGDKGFAQRLTGMGIDSTSIERPYADAASQILRDECERRNAHVLHTHGYDADALAAKALHGLPAGRRPAWVATVHGFVSFDSHTAAATSANQEVLRKGPDAIIATSVELAAALTRDCSAVSYVPNGVPTPRHDPRMVNHRREMVLFVGRLSREKRPELVADVAACMVSHPSVSFRIAGTGPETIGVAERIVEMDVSGRVEMEGFVQDMERLYRSASALLLLSTDEGTPRVLLEAMVRHIPIVATRVGGVPDLIEDGVSGLLIDADEGRVVGQAASALDRIFSDARLRRRLTEAAAERFDDQFTMIAMHDRVLKVYRSIDTRNTVSSP